MESVAVVAANFVKFHFFGMCTYMGPDGAQSHRMVQIRLLGPMGSEQLS